MKPDPLAMLARLRKVERNQAEMDLAIALRDEADAHAEALELTARIKNRSQSDPIAFLNWLPVAQNGVVSAEAKARASAARAELARQSMAGIKASEKTIQRIQKERKIEAEREHERKEAMDAPLHKPKFI